MCDNIYTCPFLGGITKSTTTPLIHPKPYDPQSNTTRSTIHARPTTTPLKHPKPYDPQSNTMRSTLHANGIRHPQ